MERAIVIRGRLVEPRRIDLDEPITEITGDVELVVRRSPVPEPAASGETVFDLIERLPGGALSQTEIDGQLRLEREGWGER